MTDPPSEPTVSWSTAAIGAVLTMVLMKLVNFVAGTSTKRNGNGVSKASVEPKDAPEFFMLQREILAEVKALREDLRKRR